MEEGIKERRRIGKERGKEEDLGGREGDQGE